MTFHVVISVVSYQVTLSIWWDEWDEDGGMKIAFIIVHTRNKVVVLFGTLKVQSLMLTEVRDCDLLIVVTSSTFLKRKDMLKEKIS